jgi:hypothetical protein
MGSHVASTLAHGTPHGFRTTTINNAIWFIQQYEECHMAATPASGVPQASNSGVLKGHLICVTSITKLCFHAENPRLGLPPMFVYRLGPQLRDLGCLRSPFTGPSKLFQEFGAGKGGGPNMRGRGRRLCNGPHRLSLRTLSAKPCVKKDSRF